MKNKLASRYPLLWITAAALLLAQASSRADDLTQTCGSNPGSGPTTQQSQYCQGASSAQQGSSAQGMAGGVWSAVATVCVVSCVQHSDNVCKYSVTGAAVATGNAASGLASSFASMNAGNTGSTVASSNSSNSTLESNHGDSTPSTDTNATSGPGGSSSSATSNQSASQPKKDNSACMEAGLAALQSVQHFVRQSANDSAESTNLANAQALVGNNAIGAPGNSASGNSAGNPQAATATTSNPFSPTGACTTAQTNGNTATYIQCATAVDPTIPGFVNSPGFANAFQNTTGQSLPSFLASGGSPAQKIAAGAAGAIGTDAAMKTGVAIAQVQTQMLKDGSNGGYGVYASSGGKSRANDSADPSLNDMMAGLMDKLGGGKDGSSLSANALEFNKAYRSPATVAENRALSIFDRVSYRYSLVNTRLR